MFNNRCTMHYVVPDYGPETDRLMRRTTAAGRRPPATGRGPNQLAPIHQHR